MERNNLIQEAERQRLKETIRKEANAGNMVAAKMLLDLDGDADDVAVVTYKGHTIDLSRFSDAELKALEAENHLLFKLDLTFRESFYLLYERYPTEDEMP